MKHIIHVKPDLSHPKLETEHQETRKNSNSLNSKVEGTFGDHLW